jgi:hypothetical protein
VRFHHAIVWSARGIRGPGGSFARMCGM